MKIYSEIELREMISNLRLVKEISNDYELQDNDLVAAVENDKGGGQHFINL